MPRYKCCPNCGFYNSPSNPECSNCGCDLSIVNGAVYDQAEAKKKNDQILQGGNSSVDSDSVSSVSQPERADGNNEAKVDQDAVQNSNTSADLDDEWGFDEVKRVKVCPDCGQVNPWNSNFCQKCKVSIRHVKSIFENEVAQNLASKKEEAVQPKPQAPKVDIPVKPQPQTEAPVSDNATANQNYVRVCPNCGAENSATAKLCRDCQTPIINVAPTPSSKKADEAKTGSATAKSVDIAHFIDPSSDGEKIIYTVTPQRQMFTIGRENILSDYLENCDYVSRAHVQIKVYNNRMLINDSKSTNGTFINNQRLEKSKDEVLNEGDLVTLGGKYNTPGTASFKIHYLK